MKNLKEKGESLFNELGLKKYENNIIKTEEFIKNNYLDILIIITIIIFYMYMTGIQQFIIIKGIPINENTPTNIKLFW